MNKSANRFKKHLKSFEAKLKESISQANKDKTQKLGKFLHENDGRTPMFQLQGLARIETKIGKNKVQAAAWLNEFKFIEDAIGKYDYWNAWKEKNKAWNFPETISNHFEKEALFAAGILEEGLARSGWIEKSHEGIKYSDKAIKKLIKSIKNADFFSPAKEKKKLLQLFRDEAMEIHNKVKSKEIDLRKLEEGIHEFRRKMRWLGIYSSSLSGKVRLAEGKKSEPLAKYLTNQNESVKFNQLPFKKDQKEPVYFLRGGFYAMSQLISEIGDIKDPGLATEEMMALGKKFGLKSETVKKHLGKDFYDHKNVVKDAGAVINNYLFKENILSHIADYFDNQL